MSEPTVYLSCGCEDRWYEFFEKLVHDVVETLRWMADDEDDRSAWDDIVHEIQIDGDLSELREMVDWLCSDFAETIPPEVFDSYRCAANFRVLFDDGTSTLSDTLAAAVWERARGECF